MSNNEKINRLKEIKERFESVRTYSTSAHLISETTADIEAIDFAIQLYEKALSFVDAFN